MARVPSGLRVFHPVSPRSCCAVGENENGSTYPSTCARRDGAGSILLVAPFRSIVVLILLALWLVTPALACLPNTHMTDAEMACCKKMAGDCHMGVGKHPCCKTVTSADVPVATLQPTSHVQPIIAVVLLEIRFQPEPTADGEFIQANLGLPPPAPPGLTSILRI